MGKVNRKEWLWVGVWAAVILAITSLPYLLGASLSTPENQFGGFVIGVEDGNSYLAKMRLGATDGWRFYLFYTSEPHEGAYLYLFYLLLGKIAWLLTGPLQENELSLILVYHLARIVCGFFLLATVYRFAAFFTDLRPARRLTFWLVAMGSGLGWLVILLGLSERLGLPLDFYSPDAFAFHALFGLPHLSLIEVFLLWAILFLLTGWEKRQVRYALLAGLALVGMTVIGAFYIIVTAAAISAGWLLRRWQAGQGVSRPWAEAGLAILALSIVAPVLLYNVYVFTTNPIFKMWGEQNRILSPSPVHYLLAFGPLALLAAIGGWKEWRRGSARSQLLIGWCAVVPLLVYIPFNLQRRLALGVQVPFSILAALGLWQLFGTGEAPRRWRVVSVGVVALLSLSNLLILTGAGLEVGRQSPPVFHTAAEVSAADWLGTHATADQVVLAAYETGNYLPTRMSARVFAGHASETVHSDAKRATLRRFFGGGTEYSEGDDDFRRRLLWDYGIDYVFYGPAERALVGKHPHAEYPEGEVPRTGYGSDFSPADTPYLQKVYDNGVVQIYQALDASDDYR